MLFYKSPKNWGYYTHVQTVVEHNIPFPILVRVINLWWSHQVWSFMWTERPVCHMETYVMKI